VKQRIGVAGSTRVATVLDILWEFKVGRGKVREKAKKPGRGEFIKKPQDNSSRGKFVC